MRNKVYVQNEFDQISEPGMQDHLKLNQSNLFRKTLYKQ